MISKRNRIFVYDRYLALLSEGPKYGLQLQNDFESRTGEVWPLNVGQVYTTLDRMERDGLVIVSDSKSTRRTAGVAARGPGRGDAARASGLRLVRRAGT